MWFKKELEKIGTIVKDINELKDINININIDKFPVLPVIASEDVAVFLKSATCLMQTASAAIRLTMILAPVTALVFLAKLIIDVIQGV
ncbi:hypothetical protein FACS1894140_5010 [Spirochaetia bacterium]|nr:hypothetical protein FACS1894140_5010 [Spirochaetia bacterium]